MDKFRYCYKCRYNNVATERAEQFIFMCSVVMIDGGALQYVKIWMKKAKGIFVEFCALRKHENMLMKIRSFNSNIKSVLLCGCETWTVTTQIMSKLQRFFDQCL
jgi:hypothetical protein